MDKQVIDSIVETIKRNLSDSMLSLSNRHYIDLIRQPSGFFHSTPGRYNKAINRESTWQREIYRNDKTWYDLELPIGQYKNPASGKISSHRIDLIGFRNGRYVLCELKNTTKAGNPFDAILQLLAYYAILQQNAATLDRCGIHHTNEDIRKFRWQEASINPILMLRGNNAYWSNWNKSTPKNRTARQLVACLSAHGITIELCDENGDRICE